ncbi:MAG: hypothetical protein JKY56_10900, partial [Kofleriaceae bacterium]|nr:hypothetical protein [Kofleriaceae bacterium]
MKVFCASLAVIAALGCSENRTPFGLDAGAEPPALDCLPNLDGVLERGEMPTQLNNPVAYLVAQEASVDLSSNAIELRNEFPGEVKIDLVAKSLADTWFADEFPADSIRVPLSSSGDTFAILRSSESSVSLLGIASEQSGHTLLHYQIPIDLYRFPMQVGSSWSSTSAVIGTLAAVPYNGTDAYETTVES